MKKVTVVSSCNQHINSAPLNSWRVGTKRPKTANENKLVLLDVLLKILPHT